MEYTKAYINKVGICQSAGNAQRRKWFECPFPLGSGLLSVVVGVRKEKGEYTGKKEDPVDDGFEHTLSAPLPWLSLN